MKTLNLILIAFVAFVLTSCCEAGDCSTTSNKHATSSKRAPKFKVGDDVLLRPNNVKAVISCINNYRNEYTYDIKYFTKEGTLISLCCVDGYMLLKPKKEVEKVIQTEPVKKQEPELTSKKDTVKRDDWWNYE